MKVSPRRSTAEPSDRLLADRGTGPPGPRGHPVRQRRLARPRPGWCLLPALAAAGPGVRSTPSPTISSWSTRSAAGPMIRRRPLPHRLSAFPGARAAPAPARHHPARPARPARPAAALPAVPEMPVVSISDGQREPLPWPTGGPPSTTACRADLTAADEPRATISPSSAASRPRSGPTGPSRSPAAPACSCASRPRSTRPTRSITSTRSGR